MVLPSHNPPLCVGGGLLYFGGFVRENCCVGAFLGSGYGERNPCTDLKNAALIKAQPLLPDTRRICAGRSCGPQADRRFRRSSEPRVRFGGSAAGPAARPRPLQEPAPAKAPHPRPAGADFRLR